MEIKEKVDVNEVISNNFFKYLKQKNMNQAQYAKENHISEATISNWKKGKGSMSAEHIRQAIDCLNLTANDLFYTDDEKKRIEVLSDKNYHSIMAQQTIETKLLNDDFEKPFISIISILGTYMFFISISIVLVRYSIWWSLLILPSFISKYLYLDKQFGEKKTYIINYLDDVYYSCDASKLSRKRSFIFYIASLIMHILVFLSTLYSFSKSSEEKYLLVVIFLLILISAGIGILGLLDYIGKYKNKMYHYEFDLYKRGITLVCSSLTLFGFAITLINFDILNHIFLIVLLLIMCILSFIHLHFVCVNYKTYVLVYEDENGKIEQLFKK